MEEYKKVSTTAQRLKEAMEVRDMKQVELSEKSGISAPSISCYLSGKYEPKQIALYHLGRALDVAEMWLSGYDAPMERPVSQKRKDALAALVERINKEEDFRRLIIRISHLSPAQLEALSQLLDSFP